MSETITAAITAAQARALRNADTITFHHRDGVGYIRAHKDARNSDTGFDQVVEIPARMSLIQDYSKEHSHGEPFDYDAFHSEHSAQFDGVTRTIVKALRPGREFVLEWWRDNRSPVTEQQGVVVDALRIRVGVDGKPADTYLVDTFVGLDNSARMVRRVRS